MADAPKSISPDDVVALARLAQLELSPAEVANLTRDLGAILGYVHQLAEVDLEGVPPTAHVQLERQPLRADVVAPSLPREVALAEAPRVADDGFAVPAFVDEG